MSVFVLFLKKTFENVYFFQERLYDAIRSPPVRVQPPATNEKKETIPLQTFKSTANPPEINNPVNRNGEYVLIDLGSDTKNKPEVEGVPDSGIEEGPNSSLNNTMIYRGNNDPSVSLITSSLRPSAPSPSFNTTPPFSSTLNPFMSINKIPRSPDGSDFQGYSSLQVGIILKSTFRNIKPKQGQQM